MIRLCFYIFFLFTCFTMKNSTTKEKNNAVKTRAINLTDHEASISSNSFKANAINAMDTIITNKYFIKCCFINFSFFSF